jgi:hypothetical protein
MEYIRLTRAAKIWGIQISEEMKEAISLWIKCMNEASQHFRKRISDGKIILDSTCAKYVGVNDKYRQELLKNKNFNRHLSLIKHEKRNKIMTQLMDKNEITWANYAYCYPEILPTNGKNLSIRRGWFVTAYRNYLSFMTRNKNRKNNNPNVNISGSAIVYPDAAVSFNKEKQEITFPFLNGSITTRYHGSNNLDKLANKSKFGGNFSIDQKAMIFAIEFDKPLAYIPAGIKGTDFNRDPESWISLSDGTKIARNNELQTWVAQLDVMSQFVNKDKYNIVPDRQFRRGKVIPNPDGSRKTIHDYDIPSVDKKIAKWAKEGIHIDKEMIPLTRRKQRKLVKRLHAKINNKALKIAQSIIDDCIANKLILGIDDLSCGGQTGTFGHEHIKDSLIDLAEKKGVPYYAVQTYYTSQRCMSCGCIDKNNRPTKKSYNEFKCINCGYTSDAQINAAENVAYFTQQLYENSIPFGRNLTWSQCQSKWSKNRFKNYKAIFKSIIDYGRNMITIDFC